MKFNNIYLRKLCEVNYEIVVLRCTLLAALHHISVKFWNNVQLLSWRICIDSSSVFVFPVKLVNQ